MLQNIRDKSTGWFSWVIIGLIVVVFALFGVTRYLGGNSQYNTVAIVNGSPITSQQASILYNQFQVEAQQKGYYAATQQFANFLKSQTLNTLTQQLALQQAAAKYGFVLAPTVLQAAIQAQPAFKVNGKFSYQKWTDFSQTNPNASSYLQQLKLQTLLNQIRTGFVVTGFTTPQQAKSLFALANQQRNISYINIPLKNFSDDADDALKTSALKAYYKKHQDQYKQAEQVRVDYIQLSLKALMQSIKPTEQALQSFYRDNISQYTKPAQWKVEAYRVPVKGDVAPALKRAQRMASALNHHDTKFKLPKGKEQTFKANSIGPSLKGVLQDLTKPGEVSRPVTTAQFVSVYRLLHKTPASQLSFSAVKAKVATAYKQQQAQQQFDDDSDKLASLTFANPSSLEPAAKALGLKVKTSLYFTKEGGKGIASNPNVVQAAFSNDVLNTHQNSQAITLKDNSQVVIRLKNYKKSNVKPFADVRAQIKTQLKHQYEMQQARLTANKIKLQLTNGKSISDVASQFNLSAIKLGFINRHYKKQKQIVYTAFLMTPQQKVKVMPAADYYTVIKLQGVRPGKPNKKQSLAQFTKILGSLNGQTAFQFYENSVIKHAQIKIISRTFS